MSKESKIIGNSGEEKACEYLKNKGYKIIDRNFRSRRGEIDIVAKDKDFFVFTEVKNYSKRSFFMPAFAIRKYKKQRIIHAAKLYVYKFYLFKNNCRFDVIAIYEDENRNKIIEHFINAFEIN